MDSMQIIPHLQSLFGEENIQDCPETHDACIQVPVEKLFEVMTTLRDDPARVPALRRLAAFDLVANNTDRKGGHVLAGDDGALWAIDNALCFHAQFKVRTVIWDFADEPLPEHVIEGANRLLSAVPLDVAALLSDDEVEAIQGRAAWMVKERRFPDDPTGRRWPWPLV